MKWPPALIIPSALEDSQQFIDGTPESFICAITLRVLKPSSVRVKVEKKCRRWKQSHLRLGRSKHARHESLSVVDHDRRAFESTQDEENLAKLIRVGEAVELSSRKANHATRLSIVIL